MNQILKTMMQLIQSVKNRRCVGIVLLSLQSQLARLRLTEVRTLRLLRCQDIDTFHTVASKIWLKNPNCSRWQAGTAAIPCLFLWLECT